MLDLGSEYIFKIFILEPSKELISWELGIIKIPSKIDYKLPEIEDHFYKQDEIYTPEPEKSEGKKSPIYPIIGVFLVVIIPWLTFIKTVKWIVIIIIIHYFIAHYYSLFYCSLLL